MFRPCRLWSWCFLALSLLLGGCGGRQASSPQTAYRRAQQLLDRERLQEAASETERGLASAPGGSRLAWNLRLLRVQILLAQREGKRALSVLGASPPPVEFVEQGARYRLCQAHAALLLDDDETAQTRLDDAQKLAATAASPRLLAEIDLRRATLAVLAQDFAGARRDLRRVLDYAAARNDPVLGMSATANMGFLLLRSSRYDEAIPWFERALSQARTLDAPISEARALGNLGSCYFRLGDLDKAIANFQQAEARFASEGNRFERQIWLGNIGNIEESKRDYAAAAGHYSQALAIGKELGSGSWTATWLNNLAVVSIELGQWDAAESYNREAMSLNSSSEDLTGTAQSLVNTGRIAQGRGQYRDAEKAFKAVLRQPPEELTTVLDAHAGLAEAFAGEGRDGLAEKEFRAAIGVVARRQADLLDEQKKLTWFASLIRLYQEYVEFLMGGGHSLEALEVVQSSRGRVLAERLGEPSGSQGPTVARLQELAARSGCTLLVYWVGVRKSYGWAISGQGIREYELPGEARLRALVTGYDNFLQELHDPLSEDNSAGHALYDLLIAPAKQTGAKVMLAPDGPLYSLNFGTLPVRDARGSHYWVEDVRISIVPSFDLTPATPSRSAPSLLLIGNPVGASPEFPELAFAGQEMAGIQASLPSARQVVYTRSAANPNSYAQSNPGTFSWIHFVAHATANQSDPLQSAVILSRDAGADYRLYARNVVRIPLHSDLVTISACRSAGARVYAGEGLVGFSWAFLKSGARNVIAGLWDVNDRSTAELMAAMYGELGKGAPPAEALRSAELSMLRSKGVFRKPYYWGPFEIFSALAE